MTKKSSKKIDRRKSKAMPEIYIKIGTDRFGYRTIYSKAHLRVKSGEYQYLEWWENGTVRSLYLGKKRKS